MKHFKEVVQNAGLNTIARCLAQKKRDQSLATVRDSQHLYAQQQHIVAH